MLSSLGDPTVLQNVLRPKNDNQLRVATGSKSDAHDDIGTLNGTQSMGDADHRSRSSHDRIVESLLNNSFRFRVERTRRLVQKKNCTHA